ncbi:MAG: Uncharacterized protein CEN91_208 [Candidatus Berkelbacteria bacterium Licking1014_85]|uniref:Uncharacterized protein n=1 Tax=Candidatus Berkelbacteria bacterium Licking1014_85 TaxID=2017148 RepID=A0A554LL18_9BACT|nr:MAG: Uncharacterized protein CEN91_208 [Candidatus Berkelbacteria bacterium Licking1014_85]
MPYSLSDLYDDADSNQQPSQTTSSQLPATDEVQDILNKDILELMGAKNMPEDKKAELYQKMLETIQNRVIARIADELSDADLDTFKTLADAGDKQKLEEFLTSKNIDIAKLMLQEALIYKTEMVTLSKPLQNAKAQNPNSK